MQEGVYTPPSSSFPTSSAPSTSSLRLSSTSAEAFASSSSSTTASTAGVGLSPGWTDLVPGGSVLGGSPRMFLPQTRLERALAEKGNRNGAERSGSVILEG